jgi:hypothetical protein
VSSQLNRVSPYRSLWGSEAARRIDGDADSGTEKKRMLPCNGADRGCVALWRQHYLAGNGANFSVVLERENSCGTDEGSKANDGGANRWCSFPSLPRVFPGQRESAASQYRVGRVCFLHTTASSFFYGGVSECSSRMNGNLQVRFLGD